jgi:hypothetical protein
VRECDWDRSFEKKIQKKTQEKGYFYDREHRKKWLKEIYISSENSVTLHHFTSLRKKKLKKNTPTDQEVNALTYLLSLSNPFLLGKVIRRKTFEICSFHGTYCSLNLFIAPLVDYVTVCECECFHTNFFYLSCQPKTLKIYPLKKKRRRFA